MLNEQDIQAIVVTLKLASVSTFFLMAFAIPLAWWLARKRSFFRTTVEVFVSLPILLPPTVLGFYVLVLLGPNGPIYDSIAQLGIPPLVFSFPGLVIGSILYSLPFVMQPIQASFAQIDVNQLEAAKSFGGNFLSQFFHIVIPTSRKSLLTAAILGFAHVVGEFGVIMMIGGSIPGKTKVLSIAIYDYVEELNYEKAHLLSFSMLIFAFVLLVIIHTLNNKKLH